MSERIKGRRFGEARYVHRRMAERMGIVIYRSEVCEGRTDVVLNAMFGFADGTDRAVILSGGETFALADGKIREAPTPVRGA